MIRWTVPAGVPVIFLLVGCLEPDPVAGEQTQLLAGGFGGSPSCGFTGSGGSPISPCKCVDTVHDLTIDSRTPTVGAPLDPVCWVDASPEMSCLLRWDVSAIPTNATVTSAYVTLSVVDGSLANYHAKRVIRPWFESEASWLNAKTQVSWETPGAKAASDRAPATVFSFSGHQGVLTATLTSTGLAAVQAWISSAADNQGVIIPSSDTHRMGISSREGATPPRLCVHYTTP